MNIEFDISKLSASECAVLAEQLWERAYENPESVPVPQSHITEINARLDALEAGELGPAEPWDKAKVWLQSL